MAKKLTEDEKEHLESLDDDDLRLEMETAVRRRKKVKEDKSAYAKACNDVIKLQEAKMDFIVDVLSKRNEASAKKVVPMPPTPPPASSVA